MLRAHSSAATTPLHPPRQTPTTRNRRGGQTLGEEGRVVRQRVPARIRASLRAARLPVGPNLANRQHVSGGGRGDLVAEAREV
eukprot:2129878-Rhodomonas_salina.1